jgi:hypothetical protein
MNLNKLAFIIGYNEVMEKMAASPFAMMGQMLQQGRATAPGPAASAPPAADPTASARARSQVSQAVRGMNMPFMGNVGNQISQFRGQQAAQSLNAAANPATPQSGGSSGYTTRGQAGIQDDRVMSQIR